MSEDVDGIAVVTSCVEEGMNDPSKPIVTADGQGKLSVTNGTEACLNSTGNQIKYLHFQIKLSDVGSGPASTVRTSNRTIVPTIVTKV